MRFHIPLRLIQLSCIFCFATQAPALPPVESAQLGTDPAWFEIPEADGRKFLVQWSRDSSLILTPNESHFPKLGLTAVGQGIVPSIEKLNGKDSFASITSWDPGDSAAWGIWVNKSGPAKVRVMASSDSGEGTFQLRIESKTYTCSPKKTEGTPVIVGDFVHNFSRKGQHLIEVENTDAASKNTHLHWLELSGPVMEGAGVIRTRWRPSAAHAKFSSTGLDAGSRIWIVEMDAVPGKMGFYAPITTPFGYYGPTWKADGTVNSGMNFSLWSYGRGQEEPPVEELSHLLAIGSPEASFGGFGHEGTGVKIRNFEPLLGRQGQRQAFALRVEPGQLYDTYFSYYYATDQKRWRLFGVGRKKSSKRPLKHLIPGTFVEVPGPPKVQRSGPTPRRMRYRGWISADGNEWHQLDRMGGGDVDKTTGLTYTKRGVEKGWFFLQTGGWTYQEPASDGAQLDQLTSSLPEYLDRDRVKALIAVPSSIKVMSGVRNRDEITLDYEIENPGKDASLTLYHGSSEGLSLEKKWEQSQELPAPRSEAGSVTFTMKDRGPCYLRLLLKNEHGQFWTWDTTVVP